MGRHWLVGGGVELSERRDKNLHEGGGCMLTSRLRGT
jgi:hypothetical protein